MIVFFLVILFIFIVSERIIIFKDIIKIFFQSLLDAGARIDMKNENEQTALHLAADKGYGDVLKEILKRKKETMLDDDEDANSALHLAAMNGRTTCISELIKRGANVNARY